MHENKPHDLKCYLCGTPADHLTSIKNPNKADQVKSIAACDTCLRQHGPKE